MKSHVPYLKLILSLFLVTQFCFAEQTEAELLADLQTKSQAGSLKMTQIPGINEIDIPKDLKSFFNAISIKNPKIVQKDIGIIITGTTEIDQTTVEITATLKVGVGTIDATQSTASAAIKASLGIMLPEKWKFSVISPLLGAIDLFQFSRVAFILSTYGYRDMSWDVGIMPGVNIAGVVTFGSDSSVAKIVPGINELKVGGSLTPILIKSKIQGEWPVELKLSDDITTTGLTIGVEVSEILAPIIFIKTGINVIVPRQTTPLKFGGGFYLSTIDARLAGAMDGMWEEPLGIPSLKIGDMGIEGTISYAGVMTGIGVRGTLALGSKSLEVAGAGDISSKNPFGALAIIGELKGGLYLNDVINISTDLINAATSAKINLSTDILPNIGFDNIKVYLAPMPIEIALKMYQQGLTIAGDMSLGITKVSVDMHLNETGIRAFGTMKEIDLGPLLITGTGPDKKSNTSDDGPVINMQIDGTKQEIYIDGLAELSIFGIETSSEQHLELGKKGFIYKTSVERTGLVWDLDVIIDWPKFKDVGVKGQVTQNTLSAFTKLLRKAADTIAETANTEDAKALKKVQKDIKDLDDKIKKEEKKCKSLDVAACIKVGTLGTERLALKVYEEALLPTMKWTTKAVSWTANALSTLGNNAINLQEMSIDANAKDIKGAKLPKVRIKGVILGIDFDETMQLDLSNLADGATKIINKIIDPFK